jgi:hypothetical protein
MGHTPWTMARFRELFLANDSDPEQPLFKLHISPPFIRWNAVYPGYPVAQPVLLLSQQVLPALADLTTVCVVLGITEDLDQVQLGHRYEELLLIVLLHLLLLLFVTTVILVVLATTAVTATAASTNVNCLQL